MNDVRLGSSGLRVSEVGLGCMTFGRWIDEAQSQAVFDMAFDQGVNLFDTADIYGKAMEMKNPGESEEILGKIMRKKRHLLILATKVNGRMGVLPNDAGQSRYHIMRAIEACLKRLQTDYIDLYQVHRFDEEIPLEETLGDRSGLRSQSTLKKRQALQTPIYLKRSLMRWIGYAGSRISS